jgi:hypothetical protein
MSVRETWSRRSVKQPINEFDLVCDAFVLVMDFAATPVRVTSAVPKDRKLCR